MFFLILNFKQYKIYEVNKLIDIIYMHALLNTYLLIELMNIDINNYINIYNKNNNLIVNEKK